MAFSKQMERQFIINRLRRKAQLAAILNKAATPEDKAEVEKVLRFWGIDPKELEV